MYICYLDESGTISANDPSSQHFVLVGLAVLAPSWKHKDSEIDAIKRAYGLGNAEVHTAWMWRKYIEQDAIPEFSSADHATRRRLVTAARTLNLARQSRSETVRKLEMQYRKSASYIHLTMEERRQCVRDLADLVGSWTESKLFAEAQRKAALPNGDGDFDEAFEQVVTRFNRCLTNLGGIHGLLVQDNNQTIAKRLTEKMRKFHREGTTWARDIEFVVETPLFVDSELTSMVQLADLCGFAIRRFFDQGENDLLQRISPVFDRNAGRLVGIRHFTRAQPCSCAICLEHGRRTLPASPGIL